MKPEIVVPESVWFWFSISIPARELNLSIVNTQSAAIGSLTNRLFVYLSQYEPQRKVAIIDTISEQK